MRQRTRIIIGIVALLVVVIGVAAWSIVAPMQDTYGLSLRSHDSRVYLYYPFQRCGYTLEVKTVSLGTTVYLSVEWVPVQAWCFWVYLSPPLWVEVTWFTNASSGTYQVVVVSQGDAASYLVEKGGTLAVTPVGDSVVNQLLPVLIFTVPWGGIFMVVGMVVVTGVIKASKEEDAVDKGAQPVWLFFIGVVVGGAVLVIGGTTVIRAVLDSAVLLWHWYEIRFPFLLPIVRFWESMIRLSGIPYNLWWSLFLVGLGVIQLGLGLRVFRWAWLQLERFPSKNSLRERRAPKLVTNHDETSS